METEEKRWFIASDGKETRWIKLFITKNIELDYDSTHLVVSMANDLNQANRPGDVMVESVNTDNCFSTRRDAEMEIIRRERFAK